MTHSGRSGHTIPGVSDDVAAKGVAGIPSTIGRVDLRQQWSKIRNNGLVTDEISNEIRNRCVLPILEKLDDQFASL